MIVEAEDFILFFVSFNPTANRSNQRNRRDTSSVTLEDVRSEIQKQLGSVTGSQLCSPPDKICLAGPPGSKGNAGMPGLDGRRGKKGESIKISLSILLTGCYAFRLMKVLIIWWLIKFVVDN